MRTASALLVVCTIAAIATIAAPARAAESDASVTAMASFLERQRALEQATAAAFEEAAIAHAESGGSDTKTCGDADRDGLSDCAETATGVFVNFNDTGTWPGNPDSDGDGLKDGEEVFGTAKGLDLPALGVNPLRKDLLLEYDWFNDDRECAPHTHRPSPAALARVRAMFANAPVANPDGSTGVNLIQDYGQGAPFSGGNEITAFNPVLPGTFDAAIKSKHFAANRTGYFHYVLMAHRYGGGSSSSGYAEIIGDDMIVTLYCAAGNDGYVANTIAHELGHNLGLHHGGFEACNGKPNYNSLMNYRYQFAGVDNQCTATGNPSVADFSSGNRVPLNENAVDERIGVCGAPAIDWNFNGQVEAALSHDLNPGYVECGAALRVLDDFDDWAGITFSGILSANPMVRALQSEVECAGAPEPGSSTLSARSR